MPRSGEVDSPQPKSLFGLVITAWFGPTRISHTAPAKTTDTLRNPHTKHSTLSGMRLVRCSVFKRAVRQRESLGAKYCYAHP